jgi:hypothetical protein
MLISFLSPRDDEKDKAFRFFLTRRQVFLKVTSKGSESAFTLGQFVKNAFMVCLKVCEVENIVPKARELDASRVS